MCCNCAARTLGGAAISLFENDPFSINPTTRFQSMFCIINMFYFQACQKCYVAAFVWKTQTQKLPHILLFFVVLLKFFCSPFESCGWWLWKKKSSSTWLSFITWASAIQCSMLFYFLIRRRRRTVLICDTNGHLNIGTSMIHTKIMHNRKV